MSGVGAALAGLTTRGRCLLAAGAALVACAFLLGQRDLLRVGVFLVALPLVAVAVVARTRYRLACTRRLEPSRVEAGRTSTVRLHLDNVSRLPSGVLLMEDALPYTLGGRPRFVLDRVEPNGARDVSYPARSEVRGRFVVGPLSVRMTDPFGLCELTRAFASRDELVVTPVVTALPPVRLGGDWAGGGDSSARAVASSGADDVATREYRHGDDLRRVHWRSTARTGELMVRREEQPFQNRATLVLDGRRSAHHGDGPASSFEWSVSAVASIGVALSRAGFGLSLLRETGASLAPAGLPLTEGLLLESLATVALSRTDDLDALAERLRRTGGGVLVAVLGDLDPAQAERLARGRSSPGGVVVLVDTESWSSRSASARSAAADRHAASAAVLTGAGWRVLPVQHGTTLPSVWPLAARRGGGRPAVGFRPSIVPAGARP
ncbi:MAG TPA: DUF58 domain-containing protein [Mycobacteriales bacterium]|nr:DUF58 domain-containing protein [Mycobacteriales bacterium]